MLVYGDPRHEEAVERLVTRLAARVAAAENGAGVDELRAALVMSGQLEQALADAGLDAAHACVREATAATAIALHAATAGPRRGRARSIRRALARARAALARVGSEPARVSVRVPEGFAFYALLPEQYGAAAARFAAGRPAAEAVVLGLRSIGTALAAMVGVALEAAGWRVTTLTARPSGHPFARRLALDLAPRPGAFGLVVDEGPGLSGSSMAAAAEALVRAGIDPARVVFFPSHAGEPGPAASESVRAWWQCAARVVVGAEEARVGGVPLRDALVEGVAELVGEPVTSLEDLGAGAHRRVAFADGTPWPAALTPFARPKYLARTASGRAMLLKFEGVAAGAGFWGPVAERAAAQQAARAARGLGPSPLGVVHGFLVRPWIDGTALTRADAARDRTLLARIGRYVACVAGPPLGERERAAAHARLAEMLVVNAGEALGPDAAERARAIADTARAAALAALPSAGDGRLAPDAWVRDRGGRVWKPSLSARDVDPTLAGAQPITWDLAGALVEWAPAPRGEEALVAAFVAKARHSPDAALLAFHCAAYAALRLGACAVAAATTSDAGEVARIEATARELRRALERALEFGPGSLLDAA